jgi:hypothetical protein
VVPEVENILGTRAHEVGYQLTQPLLRMEIPGNSQPGQDAFYLVLPTLGHGCFCPHFTQRYCPSLVLLPHGFSPGALGHAYSCFISFFTGI